MKIMRGHCQFAIGRRHKISGQDMDHDGVTLHNSFDEQKSASCHQQRFLLIKTGQDEQVCNARLIFR